MKRLLRNRVISISGDFGPQRTHEKIKEWIEGNGGRFSSVISPDVTHLICSKEHFKKANGTVKQARKIRGLHIVNFDWLEDSLMQRSVKKEMQYLLRRQMQKTRKAKATRKAVKKDIIQRGLQEFEKGCREFEEDMYSNGYHVYHDSTLFAYDIILARTNFIANQNERYRLKVGSPPPVLSTLTAAFPKQPTFLLLTRLLPPAHPVAQRLQLYESHAAPKLYATYVTYSAPGTTAKHVLAPLGSNFETAMDVWRKFFTLKTRKEWEGRLEDRLADGQEGEQEPFVYVPPGKSEPRGC